MGCAVFFCVSGQCCGCDWCLSLVRSGGVRSIDGHVDCGLRLFVLSLVAR